MKRSIGGLLVLVVALVAAAGAEPSRVDRPDAKMLRFPDISANRIVFSYASDLWTVSRQGGLARRLSSPKGRELFPKFSPDGRQVAFSGNYDGNTDVYVVSSEGGLPRRLTHHPDADLVVDWYPDGSAVLFRSTMESPVRRYHKLFRQPLEGGLPQPLPLAYGELASFNDDGSKMVFQIISREMRNWKRYRGGMASDLWLYDFGKKVSERITDFDGTDAVPMWRGDTVYFLSDRDDQKRLNIWAMDAASREVRQVTRFTEYDVKWPSLGPDAIVFENGGRLHVLDLESERSSPVEVVVPADLPDIRPKRKSLAGRVEAFSLSPSGKRALFGARGEVFTIPQKHGSARNLTGTSGIAERYPAWSPDGRWVAYLSDRTGEYELYVQAHDGKGKPRQVTREGKVYRYAPVWSPDSKQIAFSDKTGCLYTVSAEGGSPKLVDRDERGRLSTYTWSSDSRWLAYGKRMENGQGAIWISDVEKGERQPVTGGYYHDAMPVFDPSGDYVYFYSDRHLRPVRGDLDATWVYPNTTGIYAVTLRDDLDSPLAPRSDEEEAKDDEKEDGEDGEAEKKDGKDKAEKDEKGKDKSITIDFEGIESRVVRLPIDPGNFGALRAVKGKVVFMRRPAAGAEKRGKPPGTLVAYDLKKREEETVISGINAFGLSSDGKKVIYRSKSTYGVTDLKKGKKVGDGKIKTDKMVAWINPRQEWRQIFLESWRVERDYFYDPNMHGVDWMAVRKHYEKLLPYVMDREDLNYVIGEMIAELNCSHTYVRGGDMERPATIPVGLLGCDFTLDGEMGLYRFSRIHSGAPWDANARSPLRRPGISVAEGTYLLSVDGRPVDTGKDPWAAFQGLSGEVVRLTVSENGSEAQARDVIVKPISSERRLRYLAWVEENRARVEKASGGRVGYIHVPDTGTEGQNELVRQFIPQRLKEALVVDERFNGGGQVPDRFIELLNRPIYNYWARRDSKGNHSPYVAHVGPKVMLMNQWSGSGGDALPYYFRKAGLGPLIGRRTWGGLIGYSGNPKPIDGGQLTAPSFGFWHVEGRWGIEGYGVDPDYDVENPPHELATGRDAQLEKAISVIMDTLEKEPPVRPKRPPYPDRSK